MSIWKYIADRKYLIVFYMLLMIFISSVVYLDTFGGVSPENILYLNIVSSVLFIFYLIVEYVIKRRYYNQLKDIIANNQEDMVNPIPQPRTHEQQLFNNLLISMHNMQREKIERLYEEKRESQEYITTWVHEVKTPISVVRLLIESNRETCQDQVFNSIEEEIDKIESQVEQALYYSRTDDFSKDYFINELELEKVVKEVVKRNAKIFINKRIKISIDEISLSVLSDKKWLLLIKSYLMHLNIQIMRAAST